MVASTVRTANAAAKSAPTACGQVEVDLGRQLESTRPSPEIPGERVQRLSQLGVVGLQRLEDVPDPGRKAESLRAVSGSASLAE